MPSQADVECLLALSSSREKRKQSYYLLIVWASFKFKSSILLRLGDESEAASGCANGMSSCAGSNFWDRFKRSKAWSEGSSGSFCFLEVYRHVQSRQNCRLGPCDG